MFPIEIFEEILKHCDPVDLLRYKSVCSTWNSMIPRIIDQVQYTNDKNVKQTDIWYRKCRSDVPETMWSSMFDTQIVPEFDPLDYHKAKDHPCVWIGLWRSWICWRKLIHTEVTVETFEPPSKSSYRMKIINIALQNNIIAVANYMSSQIMLFKITNNDIVGIVDCNNTCIGNVHLFGTDDCIGVLVTLNSRNTLLYTVTNKIVRDYSYCVANLYWTCINLCNGYILMMSVGHCFTTITTLGEQLVKTEREWLFEDYPQLYRPIEAYGDQYLLWSEGQIYCISRSDHIAIRQPARRPEVSVIDLHRYETFKPFVVAGFGGSGNFAFYIPESNEWKMYNLTEKFRSPVTAVLFHVGILALGLRSGKVHIFDVKDVASLADLDFDAMKPMVLRLDTKAIISLKVTEHDSALYIVAATDTHVHYMKFASS